MDSDTIIVKDENRRKMLRVPDHAVLALLHGMDGLPEFIRLPRFALPAGTKVVTVYEDYASRSFFFILENEAFEPVEPGLRPPEIAVAWHQERLTLPIAEPTKEGKIHA